MPKSLQGIFLGKEAVMLMELDPQSDSVVVGESWRMYRVFGDVNIGLIVVTEMRNSWHFSINMLSSQVEDFFLLTNTFPGTIL